MMKSYITPAVEIIEIDLEDAVLSVSDFTEGETIGDF